MLYKVFTEAFLTNTDWSTQQKDETEEHLSNRETGIWGDAVFKI